MYEDRTFLIMFFILLSIFIWPNSSFGQDKKITYLSPGESAPFSGVLLTPEAFAELKIKAETRDEEVDILVAYQVESAVLGKQLEIDNLTTKLQWQEIMWKDRLALKNSQIDDLYKKLEKETRKTVWQRLSGPTHLLAGVGLSVGLFWIQSKFTNNYRVEGTP